MLVYAIIHAIYYHYMLTPFVECLVCKISTAMFFSTTDSCINSDHFPCNKNRIHIPSTSGFYGRLVDEIQVDEVCNIWLPFITLIPTIKY